jgi:hypothetical protein
MLPTLSKGACRCAVTTGQSGWMFSYVSPEERVPPDHPLRAIRQMTDVVFEPVAAI